MKGTVLTLELEISVKEPQGNLIDVLLCRFYGTWISALDIRSQLIVLVLGRN